MNLNMRVRQGARFLALEALSARDRWSGREEEALGRPRVAFPYLHAIPPNEEEAFRAFVATLARTHELIGYTEAVRRVWEGSIDKPYASLSFDDGFRSNVRAAQILEEFGTTGMFFVPTGFIGTETVHEARGFFRGAQSSDEPAMSWDQLEEMKANGHEIGNHTHSHPDISTLSEGNRQEEVGRAAELLRARLGEARHFAWPYGRFRHFTEDAARGVFNTEHQSCASAERGAHVSPSGNDERTLCLRRDHIMTAWPLRHSVYFVARSAAAASQASNAWPEGWNVR